MPQGKTNNPEGINQWTKGVGHSIKSHIDAGMAKVKPAVTMAENMVHNGMDQIGSKLGQLRNSATVAAKTAVNSTVNAAHAETSRLADNVHSRLAGFKSDNSSAIKGASIGAKAGGALEHISMASRGAALGARAAVAGGNVVDAGRKAVDIVSTTARGAKLGAQIGNKVGGVKGAIRGAEMGGKAAFAGSNSMAANAARAVSHGVNQVGRAVQGAKVGAQLGGALAKASPVGEVKGAISGARIGHTVDKNSNMGKSIIKSSPSVAFKKKK